ncbi:mucin-17 [Trichomycterus rosablanca]|uniref:mucin-17 n=1 Tax=Trichomycterus rosablanca TaxID=2290929 RepID=UPI002F358E5C
MGEVSWSVISADGVTAAPGVDTTTSDSLSAFIISIKINNRIYNDSLKDRQSLDYKALRQEVEDVFFSTYSYSPSAQYQEIAEMTFSNGSVIARSTLLFSKKQANSEALKNVFITNYQQHPSRMLDLNLNYTAELEPVPITFPPLDNIPESFHSNEINLHTSTAAPTSTTIPVTSTTPQHTHPSTTAATSTGSITPTTTSTESHDPPTTSDTTVTGTSAPLGTSTSEETSPSSYTSPPGPSGGDSTTTTASGTATRKLAEPEGSGSTASEPGVPGVPVWGIAILVLAAIILFFLLFLIILLLLCWCCWGRQRGFMNVSDPEPISYYNPDIPMYSTQSTFDSHNGKSADADSERAHKNRTGTFGLNK